MSRAIILAAGRGERLRPLTDSTPKPLLQVGAHRLIEWHLLALARGGVSDVVINTAWLEEQFPAVLGDGSRYGVRIHWSFERAIHGRALETAGGIRQALPLLGETFWVVAGDVFLPDFELSRQRCLTFGASSLLGHLWMVPNPPHHPDGDFPLSPLESTGGASAEAGTRWTWASVGLFRAELFHALTPGEPRALRPLLEMAIVQDRLARSVLHGRWLDVGTLDRLELARSWAARLPP